MGKKVGKLIKAARTGADMTQEQLARRISGLTASDISLAERGEKDLTQAQLKQIATLTGVTQASLINAAKEECSSGKKTTSTKAKTPASANSTMKVTATERKLVEAYRLADSDTKKRALNLLKGKDEGVLGNLLGGVDIADTVEDVLGDVLGGLLGNK
jgi:transcriptional regulator with XRE-family HTH domain